MLQENLFQHLTLRQIYQRSLSIFWARLCLFLALTIPTIAALAILVFAFVGNIFIDDPNVTDTQIACLRAFFVFSVLLWFVTESITRGTRVLAVAQLYAGDTLYCCGSIRKIARSFWPLLCYSLFYGLIFIYPAMASLSFSTLGTSFVLSLMSAVISAIAFIFLFPFASIVVENKSPCASIRRSWELTSGNLDFIFFALLWFSIAYHVCRYLISTVVSLGFILDGCFFPMIDM